MCRYKLVDLCQHLEEEEALLPLEVTSLDHQMERANSSYEVVVGHPFLHPLAAFLLVSLTVEDHHPYHLPSASVVQTCHQIDDHDA